MKQGAQQDVGTTPTPPIVEPPPSTEQRMRIGPIIRDVIIVWVLTTMGGFVAGVATGGPQRDPQRFVLDPKSQA